MVLSNVRLCAVLELTVLLFQLFGVMALCLHRFLPATRWAARSRIGSIVSLIGLASAGALCGRHGSEFGLFAGGTMTLLLIGMTTGNHNGQSDSADEARRMIAPEPNLAG